MTPREVVRATIEAMCTEFLSLKPGNPSP